MSKLKEYRFFCSFCGKHIIHKIDESKGTGYAMRLHGSKERRICYNCCALAEGQDMVVNGTAALHCVQKVRAFVQPSQSGFYVTNWVGTLIFNVLEYNIRGKMADILFVGPEGFMWCGSLKRGTEVLQVTRTTRRVLTMPPTREVYTVPYPYKEIR